MEKNLEMNTISVYEYPGRQAFLQLSLDSVDISIKTLTEMALDTVWKFTGNNFKFFCVDILFAQFDEELIYPLSGFAEKDSAWMLVKNSKNQLLKCEPIFKDQKVKFFDDLDKESIVRFVEKIAKEKQNESSDGITLWENMKFRSVEAKIESEESENLSLQWMNHITMYPVEVKNNEQFVYGPLQSMSVPPPLEINLTNDGGALTCVITFFWSYWTDDKMKGAEKVKNAIDSLLETGWELTFSNLSLVNSKS